MNTQKHEAFAHRLSTMLLRLNQGERLDIKQLADEFAVSSRTIQRDLNDRLGFLKWNQKGPRYYVLDKAKIGHLQMSDIERFANFCRVQDLLPQIDRRFYQDHLIQSIQVKGIHYESIKGSEAQFDSLQQAIEQHRCVEFRYQKSDSDTGKYYLLQPYALINRVGVWYVIGVDVHQGKQKTFAFRNIHALRTDAQTFTPDPVLLDNIRSNDSISHGNQLSEVIIQVNAKAAPYFKRRQLLPNQEIIRDIDDGSLLISCKNINEMEVIPTVQYWIPHAKIISPPELQHKIEQGLRQYLNID